MAIPRTGPRKYPLNLKRFNHDSITKGKGAKRLNKPFHEFIDGVIDIFRGNAVLPARLFNFCNPVRTVHIAQAGEDAKAAAHLIETLSVWIQPRKCTQGRQYPIPFFRKLPFDLLKKVQDVIAFYHALDAV